MVTPTRVLSTMCLLGHSMTVLLPVLDYLFCHGMETRNFVSLISFDYPDSVDKLRRYGMIAKTSEVSMLHERPQSHTAAITSTTITIVTRTQ